MNQSVVVLLAPGGFGKTTLLAAACRSAVARRVPVAWLTLSRDDNQDDLDAYLPFAFQEAGIDLLEPLAREGIRTGQAHPRTAILIRALEERKHPCMLALDEAEHASDPGTVDLLNHLFRNAPPCLNIAIACRELPPGLDLAQPVLGQRSPLIGAEDLRFSKADIARFFNLKLSREQLAAVAAESKGWPIALRIQRNDPSRHGAAEALAARHVVDNWIAGRFLEGFCEDDRELVLDFGLLEWVDAALVEDLFNDPHALERLLALPRLAGLLEPAGGKGATVYRLHPLLREYCGDRRRREDPERFRLVHQRAAEALAHRGATLDALRHATVANDPSLAGSIFVKAGALQLWLREGTERFLAATRFLSDATDEPRLAMARCIAFYLQGRLRDARRTFDASPSQPHESDLEIERLLVRGALMLNGCKPPGNDNLRGIEAAAGRVIDRPEVSNLMRGMMTYGQSVARVQRIEFAASIALARRAREAVVGRSAYLAMMIDSHLGQIAMVRGQVREALRRFRSAERIAKARFLEEPCLTTYAELPLCELALERNRLDGREDFRRIARDVYLRGQRFSDYATAADLATGLAMDANGIDVALTVIDEMGESARSAGLSLLQQHLAALRVALLAHAREVDMAQRTWSASGLPETDAGCLTIGAGGWRDLEAYACARILLLSATGNTGAADDLVQALVATAEEHGLRRTLMRALALRVRLRHQAGYRDAAREAAVYYLELYARTDYARPLVRAGTAAATALDRIIDANPKGPHTGAAERLLAMNRDRVAAKPRLTDREMTVLGRLSDQQDKQIAAALGLTPYGVRYHIRAIFKKLGVHRRTDAVRRARAFGLITSPDP